MAPPSRFSPRSEDLQALEARTVGREALCESVVTSVSDAVRSGQARFDVLLGPRGAGKSHLLGLIEGRLHTRLEGQAVVAGLPEELHPSSLLHLLAEILRALPAEPGDAIAQQLRILAAAPSEEALDRAVGMIRARLADRPLVLLVENLDLVFGAIGRNGQQRLRNILQTARSWSIVATSRTSSAAFFDEAEPFYGTFVPRTLEPLSAEDCREMLVNLARACERDALAKEMSTDEGLVRAQTLRHVLGGYPRAMAFIFPHLHHDRSDAVEEALQELAEELTPYFQEQMSRLSPGQRPIVELLAEHWGPRSVGEIAQATFTASSSVSTHLRRLRQESIVRSTKLGREQYYEIADPLFRIARAMKRDEVRAKTFLRVLKGWYAFRGVDVWRLPLDAGAKYTIPELDPNEFRTKRLERLASQMRSGNHAEVLEHDEPVDTGDPWLRSARIVALERVGRQSKALQELRATRQDELHAVVLGIVLLTHMVEQPGHWNETFALALGDDQRPLAERLSRATLALMAHVMGQKEAVRCTLQDAVEVIRTCLAAPDPRDREAISAVVTAMLVPFLLADTEEWALCGTVLAALTPVGQESMSFNLAHVVYWAWSRQRLHDVFLHSPESAWRLVEHLGPRARLGMMLAMHEAGMPRPVGSQVWIELREVFEKPLALGIAGSTWEDVIKNTLPTIGLEGIELFITIAEQRGSTLLHDSILAWIAVGRDLSPFRSVLSRLERLDPGHGLAGLVEVTDPNVAYVRLAAPERALVVQIAQSYKLDDRVAALRALSSEDDL